MELVCFDLQQKAFKRDQDTFVTEMRKREREGEINRLRMREIEIVRERRGVIVRRK